MALLCHQMAKSWHQGKQAVLLITKGQIKSVKGNYFFFNYFLLTLRGPFHFLPNLLHILLFPALSRGSFLGKYLLSMEFTLCKVLFE